MNKKSVLSLLIAIMMVVMILPAYTVAAEDGPVSVILGVNNVENGIKAWGGDGPGFITKETVDGKSGWKTNPVAGAKYIYLNVLDTFIKGGTNAVNITIEYFDSVESADNTFYFSYDSVANPWDFNIPKTYLTGSNTWKTVTYTLKDANFANRENGADFRIETSVPTMFGSVTVEKCSEESIATAVQIAPSEVSMYIGTTKQTVAAVLDQNGYFMNKLNVSWSSSAATVAKVDSTGKITSLKLGTAVITAKYGSLTTKINVTVTDIPGPVSITLGSPNKENGMTAFSGDGAGKTVETYDGRTGWQTNPASGAHYIYVKVSDYYIFGGKNTVKITVDYFDTAVVGEKGFDLAYDSTLTPYAYTGKTLLKGSNTWKQATYLIEDAQFSNRLNSADFRIETKVPICFAEVTVELIPTVSMRGAHVKTGSIFKDSENPIVNLVFDNQFDSGKELNVSYSLLDYSNSVVDSGGFNVNLEPNQKGFVQPLTFGVLKKGTYTVSVDAVSPDGSIKLHEDIHMGSITDLTGKPVQSFLGFNTHFDRQYGGSDIRIPLVAQAGAVSIRDAFASKNPTYINNGLANGVSTLIVTNTDPVFIQQTATSLQGIVNVFEIGNELSQHLTAQQYFEILKQAHTIIKGVDPNMKVVGGVTLPYDEPWLKALVDLGATGYLDAMSFHMYPPKNPEQGGVIDDFQDLNNYIASYHASRGITKDIELWLTEIGWPTTDLKWGGFTEIDSASYAAQLYVTNLANDVLIDKIYWYDFLNDCTDSTYYECSQGVLNVDNAPKPSFVAFNNVSNQLGGATFVQSYNTLDSDVRIFKFHRASDNQDIMVIWSNVDKQIGLKLGSSPLQLADIFGNVQQYDTIDGTTTLTASATPVYIVGDFDQAPVLATPTFTANSSVVTAAPEEGFQIAITRASGAEALSGTYEVDLPLGWQLVSGGSFSAGSTTDKLSFRAPANQSSGEIHIYPNGAAGELYGSMKLDAQMKEAVVVRTSPVVNSAGNGWDLAVKIYNPNSLEPMSGGTVTVLQPADMAGSYPFAPIAPNSSSTIKIPAPSISIDTPLFIKVQVDRDDGFSQLIERNISALTSVKADQPIQIDGVINALEWNNAASFTLNQASQVRLITDWGGPEDLSATAYTKWDSDHLYMAVRVTDNTHFNNYSPGDSWKGDSIQFAIDPGRSIEPGKLGWNENNIALNSVTNAVRKIGGIGGNNLLNSPVSIIRNGNETVYEMALKWTDILPDGMIPSSENSIGFSFLVNDNDGSLRRGWMEYMSGIGLGKDPNLFGDLILTDFPAFPVVDTPVVTIAQVSPEQSDGLNGWYTHPVTVSFIADSEVEKTEYSLDGGNTWQLYTTPVTFNQEQEYNISYRSVSPSGQVEEPKQLTFKLDGTAPVTSATVSPAEPNGHNGWYVNPVPVSLNVSYHVSGVTETVYSLDGGATWFSYVNPIVIQSEGIQSIVYRSIDHAGNVEEPNHLTLLLDKTAPSWTITDQGAAIQDGAVFLDIQAHSYVLVADDSISGVSEMTLMLDGNPYESGQIVDFAGQLGGHQLEISVVDHAGNYTEAVIHFQVKASMESLEHLLIRYIQSGDVSGPLVPQLVNSLEQAKHQLDKGDSDKAAKHMEDFVKHLENPSKSSNASETAKAILIADALALIQERTALNIVTN
jgi:hypothetical protein